MARYRIGCPITDEWCLGQSYGVYEAESDQDAWIQGQGHAAKQFGRDSGVVLALEREELFPNPKLLSGPNVVAHSILDKHPGGYPVWVRVAVGLHEAAWPEEN